VHSKIADQYAAFHRVARKKQAFTLLEVILALGLTVLVMIALGMAVNLHLRLLDSGRTKIEEAQLARNILRIIAQDLRSAVPYNASSSKGSSSGSSDMSGEPTSSAPSGAGFSARPSFAMLTAAIGISLTSAVNQTGKTNQTNQNNQNNSTGQTKSTSPTTQSNPTNPSSSSGQNSTSGQSGSSSTSGTSSTSGESGTSTSEEDSEDRTSDISSSAPQSTPGLYGNANQLQIDISRLPRVDQYMAISAQADSGAVTNADQVSDVKNVSYYVINNSAGQTSAGATATSGLVRREVGRASGVYAAQQMGQNTASSDNLEPFAPEVQEIDFLYSDGTQWLDTWDSVSNSGLPVAVQISIAITPQHARNTTTLQPNIYRLMVSIPAAKMQSSTSSSSTTSSSTTSTTQTSK
jgi:hypothetical protein